MFPSWVCGRGVPRWFGSRRQYALCCWSRNVSVSACCSRPLSGSQAATVPSVAGWDDMPGPPVWWFRLFWFCGGHGPGETPGPIPNPVAKAWRGDGTAFERVWESSAPPHHAFVGVVPVRGTTPFPYPEGFPVWGLPGACGVPSQGSASVGSVVSLCVSILPFTS